MDELLAAALLGLIQGLTEFLPVSSTAHLILASRAFGLDPDRFGLSFDVALHLGTAVAVIVFFLPTWIALLRDVLAGRWRISALIALGTLPGAVAGLALQSLVDRELRGPLPIAVGLVAGSLVFWLAERTRQAAPRSLDAGGPGPGRSGLAQTSAADAFLVGLAQAVALLPGISRSGITISAGLMRGLAREDAARLSFLMATPIILGAGVKTLLDARHVAALTARPDTLALGFAVSMLAGLGAVALLMRLVRIRSLLWFVPYRLALAVLVLLGAFG